MPVSTDPRSTHANLLNSEDLKSFGRCLVTLDRNEEQTRRELINPKLRERGWTEDLLLIEQTPGGADIVEGRAVHRKGRTDYLLCIPVASGRPPVPIALLEAKREGEYPTLGIQQARRDGKLHFVPFVFATNGHLYSEYGEDTRQIVNKNLSLGSFPTPDDLRARWETFSGLDLDAPQARPIIEPYKGGRSARWYCQDAAIRAVIEKIAKGGPKSNRVLLSMATGTGKTRLAAQLLYKLQQAGHLKRALFLCDRDELRIQAMAHLHAVFGDNARIVSTDTPQLNATVLIASYQTLNVSAEDREPRFWKENYPPGFFSHIIIDECHRSAWEKWSIILKDNPSAVHIGLTATPRVIVGGKKQARQTDEEITAHNIQYFGSPVYEYTISDGQEDGYLAQCEIVRRVVDLDKTKITRDDIVKRSGRDAYTGRIVNPGEIEEEYSAKKFEEKLLLDDRLEAMCEDLFAFLLETGTPHQKTIIFCASDIHATRVQMQMNNEYERWCLSSGNKPRDYYAFQCTGNPNLRPPASQLIPDFRGSRNSHYIATTVDLLSTGVDLPNLENIIFFQYLESPIAFYQRVGRGTRTGEPRGSKMMFRIYDYTNSTRLFGEPFESRERLSVISLEAEPAHPRKPTVRVTEGFEIEMIGEGRSVLVNDLPMPEDEYKRMIAERLQEVAPSVTDLRKRWIDPIERRLLLDCLPGGERAARLVRELNDESDCDLFDVLAELTYGLVAKSRAERVASFAHDQRRWLSSLSPAMAAVLNAITAQFARGGIDELETPYLWDSDDVKVAGGLDALASYDAKQIILETKARLFAA